MSAYQPSSSSLNIFAGNSDPEPVLAKAINLDEYKLHSVINIPKFDKHLTEYYCVYL